MWSGLIAGVGIVALLVGGGSALAYFTGSVAATGSVKTTSIAVNATNFPTLSATYFNSVLASTASFSVHNNGQTAGTATITISAPGALGGALPLHVWPVSSAVECTAQATVPAGAVTGTWAQTTVTSNLALAVDATQTYCVRTQITARNATAHASGTQTANATLSAVLTGSGWTAHASTNLTATASTRDIYPLDTAVVPAANASRWFTIANAGNPGFCADVTGESTAAGAAIISHGCNHFANQRFQLTPVNDTDRSLVTISPKHIYGMRLGVDAAGTVRMQAANATSMSQQWYVQRVGASSSWQLVSAASGLCMTVAAANTTAVPVARCDAPDTKLKLTREPLTFDVTAVEFVRLGFTAHQVKTDMVVQVWRRGKWEWVADVMDSNPQQESFSVVTWGNGDHSLRVIAAGTNIVMYDGIIINVSGLTITAKAGFG